MVKLHCLKILKKGDLSQVSRMNGQKQIPKQLVRMNGAFLGIIRGNYFVMPRQPVGMSTEDMSTREIMAELKKIIDAKGMSVEEFLKKWTLTAMVKSMDQN